VRASVIVGAVNVERVLAFEAKHDAVLIVHANCVVSRKVECERVQPIPGRYPQVVDRRHRVNLVELAPNGGPQLLGDPPGGFAVDTVPDTLGGVSANVRIIL